jgi:hypothetical protein
MAIRSANYDFVNIGRPIGDKFSSRSDKGTVGVLVAAHDICLHCFGARARYRHEPARAAL